MIIWINTKILPESRETVEHDGDSDKSLVVCLKRYPKA